MNLGTADALEYVQKNAPQALGITGYWQGQ